MLSRRGCVKSIGSGESGKGNFNNKRKIFRIKQKNKGFSWFHNMVSYIWGMGGSFMWRK